MSWRVMLNRCCGSRAVPFPSAEPGKAAPGRLRVSTNAVA